MRDPLRCERGIRSLGTGRAWRSPAPAEPGADKVHAGFAGWEEADLMAVQSPDDERQWAAEKRDFVADRRDELAAERDRPATRGT